MAFRPSILASAIIASLALSSAVSAQQTLADNTEISAQKKNYQISANSLEKALNTFGQQANITLIFSTSLVTDLKSNGLNGQFSPEQALQQLLKGSGLAAIKQANGSYVIKKLNGNADNSNVVGTLALTQITSGARFGDAPKEEGGFKADYQKTATKMAMKIIDTPQAISAVTRDALDARMVNNIASAVELTPSISNNISATIIAPDMFGGYGKTSNAASIRGQAADTRIDGFEMAIFEGDDDGMDMAAFERIEVVRGPSGFYGAGSLGGFINKVRKKPQAEFGANVSVQAGSYDTYRAEAGITGAINDDETSTWPS